MSAPTASPENEALTPSSLGTESPPPPPRPPPPQNRLRPPISLKMPINNQSVYSGPQTAFIYGTAPIVIPMTPTGGHPLSQQDVAFSLLQAYPNKASEFMFKQFEGFRDFTMNTAKSGLSVGEKLAFWMYGKMRTWSRKWFTHFFLLLVVCAYSLLGAFMFVAVEGEAEQKSFKDMRQSRRELLHKIHKILIDVGKLESIHDEKEWMGRAMAEMISYEVDVIDQFKRGPVDRAEKPLWNFWSAVFYCGTIYTTIDVTALRLIEF